MTVWLALDIGERRIGMATGSDQARLARPVAIITRRSKREDFAAISRTIAAVEATHLLVGLPFNMDGSEGLQATRVRNFVRHLQREIPLPVEYWDERLSSFAADEILNAVDHRRRRSRGHLGAHNDDVAAAIILQSYFDERRLQAQTAPADCDPIRDDTALAAGTLGPPGAC